MKFTYFDIHSHLNLKPLLERAPEIAASLHEKGIGTITVGTDYETSRIAVDLAEKYDNLWATVGLHPNDNESENFDKEKFKALAQHPKVVAIGECGLDYYRGKDEAMVARQKEIFKHHILLAEELGKPLMIHARPAKNSMDAYTEVLDILEAYPDVKANFHFFVGDVEIAKRALAARYTMSFDGPITFSRDYDEVIKFLPIESIMAETDAPFAAPEPYRGKTCEPYMVEEVVKKIAEIKGLPLLDVQKALLENVKRVFGVEF